MSWGGLCIDCSTDAVITNAVQISRKEGPAYEKWRAGIIANNQRRFKADSQPVI